MGWIFHGAVVPVLLWGRRGWLVRSAPGTGDSGRSVTYAALQYWKIVHSGTVDGSNHGEAKDPVTYLVVRSSVVYARWRAGH